ncbi:PREDICTED: h-2 class I histocompatibility antigen, Q7 alpha chain-like [Odobenus rosmarus divergens]|uniref:H-2 class I histocompatibility antigen, Q7 alpha chain-like n=1 Tax=Odobenus rosmarus divergens TaxID=9708 RepID=A0A9B0HA25_ODORO
MQTAAFLPTCTGMHSTQRMFGCEIREDGHTSSLWQFGFDERCYAEYDKAYLEGLCLISLCRYLELGGQSLTRKEPPTVQVTGHTAQDGGITLKCWARGFYPRDISLSWWLGEEELVLETEYVATGPSGDGTYQTWVAVRAPARMEDRYTCHVQHSSLNHILTVAWATTRHRKPHPTTFLQPTPPPPSAASETFLLPQRSPARRAGSAPELELGCRTPPLLGRFLGRLSLDRGLSRLELEKA